MYWFVNLVTRREREEKVRGKEFNNDKKERATLKQENGVKD